MVSNVRCEARRHRTLRGKRVLVTRARAQAGDFVQQLQALGAVPIVVPTIDIVPPADAYAALDAALGDLSTFDWVIFTSVNGVLHVWQRLLVLGLAAPAFAAVKVAAIGPATAEALRAHHVDVALVPEHYVAEALTRGYAASGWTTCSAAARRWVASYPAHRSRSSGRNSS